MVWDAHTKTHTKPLANKLERAMVFRTGTTVVPKFFEGQLWFVLGESMDLKTMVWTVDLCLELQRHHGDLLYLEAKDSNQRAQRSTPMEGIKAMVVEKKMNFLI